MFSFALSTEVHTIAILAGLAPRQEFTAHFNSIGTGPEKYKTHQPHMILIKIDFIISFSFNTNMRNESHLKNVAFVSKLTCDQYPKPQTCCVGYACLELVDPNTARD